MHDAWCAKPCGLLNATEPLLLCNANCQFVPLWTRSRQQLTGGGGGGEQFPAPGNGGSKQAEPVHWLRCGSDQSFSICVLGQAVRMPREKLLEMQKSGGWSNNNILRSTEYCIVLVQREGERARRSATYG